jgi:flagellin-like hook-associated protein FlgL
MRIATSQIYQQGINNMIDVSKQLARTQAQVSSGQRFSTPADDPVAASQVVQINQELALRDQYQKNIQQVSSQLALEDSVLGQATDVLQRIRELTIQSGDGALTNQDRASIATEISTRTDELLSLMNSRTASGEYLFAGSRGQTQRSNATALVSGIQRRRKQRRVQVTASSSLAIQRFGARRVHRRAERRDHVCDSKCAGQPLVGDRAGQSRRSECDRCALPGRRRLWNSMRSTRTDCRTSRYVAPATTVSDGLQGVVYHPGDAVTVQRQCRSRCHGTAAAATN